MLFGAAHYAGFLSGPIGMVMARGWGLFLGITCLRSGGILVSSFRTSVHGAANAVGTVAVAVLTVNLRCGSPRADFD
ncbi:hypothetical protein ACFU8Q_20980 [Streptomyces sp. NPDC057543]|uniref:hypothetical protein n=1 Tax=Streptomyces sp. NPDC057543 TaxID=3346163 RepID=UPI0036B7A683